MNIRAFGRLLFSGFALPKLAFRESNFLPEPKPESLFEALRSKRFVRRMGIGLVLVMGSTFAALQANADPTLRGENSTIDRYLQVNVGGPTNQFAQHPDTNFTNSQTNGTWEAWIYPTSATGRQAIFSKEFTYHFGLDSGRLWSALYQGGQSPPWRDNVSNVEVPLNTWSHVAFIKIGDSIVIYLNGDEVIYWPGGAFSTLTGNSEPFTIGRRSNGEFFSGRIDEVKIWNTDRRNQVRDPMHSRVAGNSSGLQGYWDFNEPGGTTAYDRTIGGYVRDLTLINSPTRADVKSVSALASGATVVTFPRTYLPSTSTWTIPSFASSVKLLVVGAGGGGGSDNGAGGGGGEIRASSSQQVTAGGTVTIKVGQGGRFSSFTRFGATAGESSTVVGAGLDYMARGGAGGGDFGTAGAAGGSGGKGGSGSNGAQGGKGSGTCSYSSTLGDAGVGSNGPTSSIGASTSRSFGGGGGGGSGWETYNAGGSVQGVAGGSGGGGRGASYKLNPDGITPRTGASPGQEGAANTGGGGGGGSACSAYGSDNGKYQRTDGGNGGTGVVIFEYTPPNVDMAWDDTVSDAGVLALSDYVIPNSSSADFTFEAWILPAAVRSNQYEAIFQQRSTNSADYTQRYGLWLRDDGNGQQYLYVDLGATDFNRSIPNIRGQWNHVAMAVTGSTTHLYLNGSYLGANTVTRLRAPGGLFSLSGNTFYSQGFKGQIDNVKVWNQKLEANEIQESMHTYAKGSLTASKTLLAHYDFNEYTEGALVDRSGNNKTLNPSSALTWNTESLKTTGIVETSTPFSSPQTVAKFNRTYLTAAGGWTPPANVSRFKTLVVAGGGGGGGGHDTLHGGGGGGAGGLLQPVLDHSTTVLRVQVGAGGAGGAGRLRGGTGQNSILGTSLTANGGGGGGAYYPIGKSTGGGGATTGGSGGGAGAGEVQDGADPTSGQGFAGGNSKANTAYGAGGGGAGALGGNNYNSGPGAGGNGLQLNITGTQTYFAGGGGGGSVNTVTGTGGLGGGGRGSSTASGQDQPVAGTANTGGGGGGGRGFSGGQTGGGAGGSGVVILSYGANLEVTRTATAARAGSNFAQSIQVTAGNGSSEHDVTVTATGQVLRVGNAGTAVTSVTVRTVGGVATFTDLGFTANVGNGSRTLTFTADAFVGTTLTMAPTFIPGTVTVTGNATSGGQLFQGLVQASSSGATVNIQASELVTALSSGNVLVESTGNVTVSSAVLSTTPNSNLSFSCSGSGTFATNTTGSITIDGQLEVDCHNITIGNTLQTTRSEAVLRLKSRTGITVGLSQTLQTNGGDLVLWSSSAGASGQILINNNACLNTNNSCDQAASIATGNIIIGGGASGISAPSGPASNSVEAIRIGTADSLPTRIHSGGGNISISGVSTGSHAISAAGRFRLIATSGSISISGSSSLANSSGVRFASNSSTETLIRSSRTTDTAIRIFGAHTNPGTDISTSTSHAVAVTGSWVKMEAPSGGSVLVEGSSGTTKEIPALSLDRLDITAAGGNIAVSGSNARFLNSSYVGSGGSNIQIRMNHHITFQHVELKTSGPNLGVGGEISVWSDSDGDDVGQIFSSGNFCISTVTECNANVAVAPQSGGANIWVGGGLSATSNAFSPPGGSPSTGSNPGISFATLGQPRIYSGGGDISIASETASSTAGVHGQAWAGGARVDSGVGQIRLTNFSNNTASANILNGIVINSTGTVDTRFSSSKTNGDAIRIVSSISNTGDRSIPLFISSGSVTRKTVFSATGGGDIYFEGNSSGTGAATYSFDISNATVSATTGRITFRGNRGAIFNTFGSGDTNIGAGGASSGDISFEGNRFANAAGNLALNMRTAGTLTIAPLSTATFAEAVTFPTSGSTTNVGVLIVGSSSNTTALTVGGPILATSSVTYRGGAQTVSAAVTSSTSRVSFLATAASGSFSKTASTIRAAEDVVISSALSTVSTGVGLISAGRNVEITSPSDLSTIGTVTATGNVSVTGVTVTTSGALTSTGSTFLTATGTSSDLTIGSNITTTGTANEIVLKSKFSVVNSAAVTITTNRGSLVFWADTDGNSTGVNRTWAGSVFNTINGSTSDSASGGGDMVFAGGATVDSNNYPAGYSFSDGTYAGFHSGYTNGTCAKTFYYTGGGRFLARAKTSWSTDAIASDCSIQLWANAGQIEMDGQSTNGSGIGIQLQRNANNAQSEIFSSSNVAPAIRFTAISNGSFGFLSGYNHATANRVMIQNTGTGGVTIVGRGGGTNIHDVGLNATSILSQGPISVTGKELGGTAESLPVPLRVAYQMPKATWGIAPLQHARVVVSLLPIHRSASPLTDLHPSTTMPTSL
jgi:hypothetical protein